MGKMVELSGLGRTLAGVGVAALLLGGGAARAADAIPYPGAGVYNATTYSFTAVADGDVLGYIVGGFGAGFENKVGLLINGVLSGNGYGLNNHTSVQGDVFNFGTVSAGDSLIFVLNNLSLGAFAYSDASLNGPYDVDGSVGHNHVFSTAYTATDPLFAGVPAGRYVGFEDLPFPDSDFNYNDESFVFTNTAGVANGVPEPASWALMILGFGGVGAALRRRMRPLAI